jgi:hypothetical protein
MYNDRGGGGGFGAVLKTHLYLDLDESVSSHIWYESLLIVFIIRAMLEIIFLSSQSCRDF